MLSWGSQVHTLQARSLSTSSARRQLLRLHSHWADEEGARLEQPKRSRRDDPEVISSRLLSALLVNCNVYR